MMRFSQAVEYGILGIIELAKSDDSLSLKDLARKARVPENFLAKIFQKLQRSGIVLSKRGKSGGFTFPKKNLRMNLWEVYSAIEEDSTLQKCVGENGELCSCDRHANCTLQMVWSDAQKSLSKALKHWTIADLVEGKKK